MLAGMGSGVMETGPGQGYIIYNGVRVQSSYTRPGVCSYDCSIATAPSHTTSRCEWQELSRSVETRAEGSVRRVPSQLASLPGRELRCMVRHPDAQEMQVGTKTTHHGCRPSACWDAHRANQCVLPRGFEVLRVLDHLLATFFPEKKVAAHLRPPQALLHARHEWVQA